MAGRLVSLWREWTYLILLQDAITQCPWYNSAWINVCVCGHKEAGDDVSAQTDYLLNIKSGKTARDWDTRRKNNVLLVVVSHCIKYQNFFDRNTEWISPERKFKELSQRARCWPQWSLLSNLIIMLRWKTLRNSSYLHTKQRQVGH